MRQLYDHQGRSIGLGNQLGTGGEGDVFEIAGQSTFVAKTYHRPIPGEKRRKLSAMVQSASPDLLTFAAWPTATLHATRGGDVVGLIMPRVSRAKLIHQLYSPAQRRSEFPYADWHFLIRTARNSAAAFATLHKHGIVIGDVNQGNVLVSDKAIANLIDCDSFQFRSNGQVFLCEVGVPHFTPPELQSAKLNQVARTSNHDCFGLALLIFHLLFVGRHPFAGRFSGSGDMPIERAIREYRFAYSRNAAAVQMSPPPCSLPMTALPMLVAAHFERAFARGSEAVGARPTAEQWSIALDALEKSLRKCPDDPGHVMSSAALTCPWCEIERLGGQNFFISVSILAYAGPGMRVDGSEIWAEIVTIRFPDLPFHRAPRIDSDSIVPQPVPPDLEDNKFMRSTLGWVAVGSGSVVLGSVTFPAVSAVAIAVCIVFAVWWLVLLLLSPTHQVRAGRAKTLRAVKSELSRLQKQLNLAERKYRSEFLVTLESLDDAKAALGKLEQEKIAAFQKLQASVRDRQLAAHLDSFYIQNSKLKGIGAGRVSALLSHGIETALDIDAQKLLSIPGFGLTLTGVLLAWRHTVESRFRFDASKGVPQSEIQAIEMQFLQRRNTFERQLRAGPKSLRDIIATCAAQLSQIDSSIAQAEFTVAQSTADLKACG